MNALTDTWKNTPEDFDEEEDTEDWEDDNIS